MGHPESLFWTLTPRQLSQHFKAFNQRLKREHQERAWLAWMTARLYHMDPKKAPKLEVFMGLKSKPIPQTHDQMLSIVKAMNAAMRGVVKK